MREGLRLDQALLQDRYVGSLVGTAVGDALGAPVEGRRWVTQAYVDRLDLDPGPLTYTDDTHMTIGVAASLVECRGFDGEAMSRTLAANYAAEPWRGYGAGPPEIFGRLERGERWDQVAGTLFGGSGSFGNGGAMRVAPAALLGFPDLDRVAHLAAATARLTHSHPEGVDGAVVQAVAIAVMLGSDPHGGVDRDRLLPEVSRRAETEVFRRRLEDVGECVVAGEPREAARMLGTGIEARASVPTALFCFLRHPGSLPDAVKLAVSLGGDTDTIAAMTGALCGARLGASAIPPRWREVEGAGLLAAQAQALFHLAEPEPGDAR